MVRYYRRRYRPYSKKDKWSVETKSIAITTNTGATNGIAVMIIPPSSVEGKRTVKNITISMSVPLSFRWVLVYVPEGTQVGTLNQESVAGQGQGSSIVSMYEPNQYVINAGTYDSGAGPNRIFSPLARTLNSGDRIFLLIRGSDNTQLGVMAVARYAIKYN